MTSPAGFGLGMADYFQSGLGPTSASQGKSPPDLEMDAEVLKADVADSALSAADVSLNPKPETLPVNRSSSRLRPRFLYIRTNICLHTASPRPLARALVSGHDARRRHLRCGFSIPGLASTAYARK